MKDIDKAFFSTCDDFLSILKHYTKPLSHNHVDMVTLFLIIGGSNEKKKQGELCLP
jgi:hypothetical protein